MYNGFKANDGDGPMRISISTLRWAIVDVNLNAHEWALQSDLHDKEGLAATASSMFMVIESRVVSNA
eukprot:2175181-Amphidinium_carterae.3